MADTYKLTITLQDYSDDINDSYATPSDSYIMTVTAALKNDYIPRIQEAAIASTITPSGDSVDFVDVIDLNTNTTFQQPSGTPRNGQKLMFRIRDAGTSVTITWNSVFASGGIALPVITIPNKWMHVGFIYNTTASKWLCLAMSVEQ